jgi:hypothetical protein
MLPSGPALEPLVRKIYRRVKNLLTPPGRAGHRRRGTLPPPCQSTRREGPPALAVRINGADAIRQDILDIATELEGQGG